MRIYHTLRMQRKYPLLLIVALLVAWGSLPLAAQNATISPSLGNLISAFTHNPHEVGFEGGYGSLWQHKQLPITYSCSEEPVLSKDVLYKGWQGEIDTCYRRNTKLLLNINA